MTTLKHILILLLLLVSVYLIVTFNPHDGVVFYQIIAAVFLILYGFTLITRKKFRFKSYFTSDYNFLCSKYKTEIEVDFSKDIMFKKIVEVLADSKFSIEYQNENTGEILAISELSWVSWGENLYISIKDNKEKVTMTFISVSIFGIYSWGKNEENFRSLISSFEESLTI